MAPVVLALRGAKDLSCRVVATAQHRQMLDQVLEVFGIEPDSDLDLMRPGQSLAALTARAVEAIDAELAANPVDLLLAQGDTTTVLCAALAAFYRRIPFAHVEAGLRTFNLDHPWPEEANRVLASRLATIHFAPTDVSAANLLREGVDPTRIAITGNTVIDALQHAVERNEHAPPIVPGLPNRLQPGADGARGTERPLVLITGHRRENFGAGFDSICRAIATLARRHEGVDFVYPVHLNPQVRAPVERLLGIDADVARPNGGAATQSIEAAVRGHSTSSRLPNVFLIEPLSYLPFVALMNKASIVLTDSGGVQEEAPGLGKPVLVMRETTERPEAVTAGTVRLVGTDESRIVDETTRLLTDAEEYRRMSLAHNPYGDGRAAARIVEAIRAWRDGRSLAEAMARFEPSAAVAAGGG